MTVQEVQVLLTGISKIYPSYKVDDPKGTIEMWHFMLEGYSFEDIKEALRKYEMSNKSGYAPSPGQLVNMIHINQDMSEDIALEAWATVYKAICNSLNNSKEEFEKLPELCKQAVGSPANLKEWASMNIDTVNSVGQGQFIKAYTAAFNRHKMERRINRPVSFNSDRIGMDESQALLN